MNVVKVVLDQQIKLLEKKLIEKLDKIDLKIISFFKFFCLNLCRAFFFIWALIPNIIGLIISLFVKEKYKFTPKSSKNKFIDFIRKNILFNVFGIIHTKHILINRNICIGLFIFYINDDDNNKVPTEDMLHFSNSMCLLSSILGPLHILFVGIPYIFYMLYLHIFVKKKCTIEECRENFNNFYITKLIRILGEV